MNTSGPSFSFSSVYPGWNFNVWKLCGIFPNRPLPGLTAKTIGGESNATVIMDVRIRASNARIGRVSTARAVEYSGEDVGTADSSTKYHTAPETFRIFEGESEREMDARDS